MKNAIREGDWVRSYSMGYWRVWRVLSGFNELRFRLEDPKLLSSRTLVFSHRLLNDSWSRSFSTRSAEASLVARVSPEEELHLTMLLESNPPLRKAFDLYCNKHKKIDLVANLSLGQILDSDTARLRMNCEKRLGAARPKGFTMDEALQELREAGFYTNIGKLPVAATIQFVSANHELRDKEFVFKYSRILPF